MFKQLVILFFTVILSNHAIAAKNSLVDNPSPYLAMHGQDPVHWQQWNKQTVDRARKENKLIFVSIGYFACHWCHVMQRESYKAEDIAALLNKDFISVKIDRELNPALDAQLIEFVERTRGQAGWPLNVFITPEGYPLLGLTYLPHDGFKDLVTQLTALWKDGDKKLSEDAKAAASELEVDTIDMQAKMDKAISPLLTGLVTRTGLQRADTISGGFGNQTKFPLVPQMNALFEAYKNKPNKKLGDFLQLTLDSMQNLGMNDSLGGGFFRYTTDPQWQVPHFEKMLYDNAQLAKLYLDAAKLFNKPGYLKTAKKTLDFMANTLGTKSGGMVGSLSAIDDNNIEGGYYLWTPAQLEKILSKDETKAVRQAWQIAAAKTTEDGSLPMVATDLVDDAKTLGVSIETLKKQLSSASKKMLTAREQRGLPVDSKRLAGWNGLALSAFVEAVKQTDSKEYREIAKNLRNFLLNDLWQDGKLLRARSADNKIIGNASLQDYAFVSRGLLDWAMLTNNKEDKATVRVMINQAWQRFFSDKGWRMIDNSLIAYGGREIMIPDGPMPSPSAILLNVTQDILAQAGSNKEQLSLLQQQYDAALSAGQSQLMTDPYWFSSYAQLVMRQPQS